MGTNQNGRVVMWIRKRPCYLPKILRVEHFFSFFKRNLVKFFKIELVNLCKTITLFRNNSQVSRYDRRGDVIILPLGHRVGVDVILFTY